MRRAVAVAVGVAAAVAAGVALLRIVGPKQNREQQQVLGFEFKVSRRQRVFGFFLGLLLHSAYSSKVAFLEGPKRKTLAIPTL